MGKTEDLNHTIGVVVILIGIFSNSLVVCAVWKRRSLRSTTNLLLVNLAISDIISLSFLPFLLVQKHLEFNEGPFADFLCKFFISWHIPVTASYASILTLTVLAVERYHAIVKPMRTGIRLNDETIGYAIAAIWLIAFAISSPFYIFGCYDKKHCIFDRKYASNSTKLVYIIFCAIVVIIGPFVLIVHCYIQVCRELFVNKSATPHNVIAAYEASQKRKLVKMAFSVTFAYMLCLFPVVFTHMFRSSVPSSYRKASVVLFFLEHVVNPLLYSFQSSNFREAFKEILRCRSNTVGAL